MTGERERIKALEPRQVRPDSGEDMDPARSFAYRFREIMSSPAFRGHLLSGMVFSST